MNLIYGVNLIKYTPFNQVRPVVESRASYLQGEQGDIVLSIASFIDLSRGKVFGDSDKISISINACITSVRYNTNSRF